MDWMVIENLFFFIPLIVYPTFMLISFLRNKKRYAFSLLFLVYLFSIYSIIWASKAVIEGMCTQAYLFPLLICLLVNIFCVVIHIVSKIYEKKEKSEG